MRFVARDSVGCDDLGRRVTVRYRLPDGRATDVVGVLETCDEATLGVRDRSNVLRVVVREDVVASRVIPAAPPRRPSR
jgi:hypothetical protein